MTKRIGLLLMVAAVALLAGCSGSGGQAARTSKPAAPTAPAADQGGTGPVYFKLTGPDGTAYEASPTSDTLFIFNTPQPINAGETREIMIAYAVPTGTGPLQWAFEPFVEGGQASPAVVNIK